ncbi:MAG: WD40/YVTN/BNR-like repeat-containing protein [Isosphaeraceae bacterium]
MSRGEFPDPTPSPETAPLEEDGGPLERQRAFLGTRFAVAREHDEVIGIELAPAARGPLSMLGREAVAPPDSELPGADLEVPEPSGFRRRVVEEYRRRFGGEGVSARGVVGGPPQAPRPSPAPNWVPIGPVVARQGQAAGRPAVSGRVAGIAVAPGGGIVYVASANGGVWRSDDGGRSWRSTMDGFDLDPTHPGSDSLACGAIAIDPADPDRVYVGTGEGAGAAYFGVGPIRSDDGGRTWITEPTAPGSEELAGRSFFRVALDPADRERVVAATAVGLYRREPDGQGGFHWVLKRQGRFTTVVASLANGVTTFFAAEWGGVPLRSSDGDVWANAGAGFPTSLVGRIGLAARPGDPSVVYALVARSSDFHLRGVWRFDAADGLWREVTGAPTSLFGPAPQTAQNPGQGWYDLAIAIDPNDPERIYLGGSTRLAGIPPNWSSSVYRCVVRAVGQGAGRTYSLQADYVGANIHADVHALEFVPGDSQRLWVGCDGGVFLSEDGGASFSSRNLGLATLTLNHLGPHPTEDAVLFAGSQDNGTLRFTGDGVWLHCASGDGGTAVVHRENPYRVVRTYTFGEMDRAEDGGRSYASWSDVSIPSPHTNAALFYAPMVGTPAEAGGGAAANLLAFGGRRPWISRTFGGNWVSIPDDASTDDLPAPSGTVGLASALAFASANRLYVGTLNRQVAFPRTVVGGRVFRFDHDPASGAWTRTRIDAAPLLNLPVTDVAIDPADPSGASIYVTLGGTGDFRHLWHFDGQVWQARGGPSAGSVESLLDVQHNTVVVDPDNPAHVYVGADIGVWRSTDAGATWAPFSFGLPDAAVLDLALNRERRLLRAATHGRGAFEYDLDASSSRPVELYVRDTWLDRGRRPSRTGLPDPTQPGAAVDPRRGPDVKIDVPPYQSSTVEADSLSFTDRLVDRSDRVVATRANQATVLNRVYVQVHNRGLDPASDVRLTLLLARVTTGGALPALPVDHAVNVRDGIPITNGDWRTVATASLDDLRAGRSGVAVLDLPSTRLRDGGANPPARADWCLLAIVHCPDDPFDATERDPDALALADRKAVLKQFVAISTGAPAPPAPFEGLPGPTIALRGVSRTADGKLTVRLRLSDADDTPIPPDRPASVRLALGDSETSDPLRYHRGWRCYWATIELPPAGLTEAVVVAEVDGQTLRERLDLSVT